MGVCVVVWWACGGRVVHVFNVCFCNALGGRLGRYHAAPCTLGQCPAVQHPVANCLSAACLLSSPPPPALQAPGHALPFTEEAVRQSFGFGVRDLFEHFDAEPVASGSIGQIHRGVLSATGARLTGMTPGA